MAQSRVGLAGAFAACAGVLGIAGVVYGYGCSVYDSSLLLPAADAGPDVVTIDTGIDARDSGAIDTGAGPCALDQPPPPPAMDDPSDAGDQTFVVALHTIDVGLGDAGTKGLSYDLDGVYTHKSAPACGPESCNANVTGFAHPDGPGGRDDSAGILIGSLASVDSSQFNVSTISQRLENGTYSILVQVLHYNGQPNDTQVTAALYASLGVDTDAGANWDGKDSWSIDSDFVAFPDAASVLPNHFDSMAYVSGGTLVLHINFPISLGTSSTGSFTISLTSGVITGAITPAMGTYAIHSGMIAGRWNASDLLGAVQGINVLGKPICRGTATYETLIKPQVCQYADIMTDQMQDQMGKTCDALSLGIAFTADPAMLGTVVTPPVKASPCEAGVGAEPDTCGP